MMHDKKLNSIKSTLRNKYYFYGGYNDGYHRGYSYDEYNIVKENLKEFIIYEGESIDDIFYFQYFITKLNGNLIYTGGDILDGVVKENPRYNKLYL